MIHNAECIQKVRKANNKAEYALVVGIVQKNFRGNLISFSLKCYEKFIKVHFSFAEIFF